MIREVDELGLIILPNKLREKLHISAGDKVKIRIVEEVLILTKVNKRCYF